MSATRSSVVAVGDNVVDRYDSLGLTFPGGNCVNVAVFAARAGASSAYVGVVGHDSDGDLIHQALQAESVNVTHLHRADGRTAYCVIGHHDGDRVFLRDDLGVSRFHPSPDDLGFIGTHDAAHVGFSSGLDADIAAMTTRTRLSYDFSVHRDADHVSAVAPLCYLAAFSGGDLTLDEIEGLSTMALQAGAEWVLITRGAAGAFLAHRDALWLCPPAEAPQIVDTLGAGDAFIAATLVGLLDRKAPSSVLSEAAAAAARTCAGYGAFGYPRTALVAALQENTPRRQK